MKTPLTKTSPFLPLPTITGALEVCSLESSKAEATWHISSKVGNCLSPLSVTFCYINT